MKTSDVLRKAGDVLRKRGWCQGWFIDVVSGAVCPAGAVNVSCGREPENCFLDTSAHTDRKFEAAMRLCGVVSWTPGHFPMWNDMKGRTAAEVMHTLDAAYVLALQEEGENLDDYEVL